MKKKSRNAPTNAQYIQQLMVAMRAFPTRKWTEEQITEALPGIALATLKHILKELVKSKVLVNRGYVLAKPEEIVIDEAEILIKHMQSDRKRSWSVIGLSRICGLKKTKTQELLVELMHENWVKPTETGYKLVTREDK